MNELNCSVVRDLLALYAEGMVEDETRSEVGDHLKKCAECSKKYDEIKSTEGFDGFVENKDDEVKPLKKLRFHMILNLIGLPLWLPIFIAIFAVLFSMYVAVVSVILSAWCVPLSLAASSVFLIIMAFNSFSAGFGMILLLFGGFLVCAGLAVIGCFACYFVTKWFVKLNIMGVRKLAQIIREKYKGEVE